MKRIGLCVLTVGALIVLLGLFKSGAAEYSDTLNMGLLNDKTNLTLTGGFTSVVGAIFAAAGIVADKLNAGLPYHDAPVVRGDL